MTAERDRSPRWWVVRVDVMSADDPVVATIWETEPTAVEDLGEYVVAGYPTRERAEQAAGFLGDRAAVTRIDDESWADAWQVHARPVVVGTLAIVPTWCPPPEGDLEIIHLDPGRSFGSGSHPSTRLVLQHLPNLVGRSGRVLDVGTGTGVLAVTAARLGAKSVVGIDIESAAVETARANAERNEVTTICRFGTEALDQIDGRFDVVVANILPGTLLRLADDLMDHLEPAGRLVLSGVPTVDVDRVAAGFRATELARSELEGWSALVFTHPTR